jgi:hypothetical protein
MTMEISKKALIELFEIQLEHVKKLKNIEKKYNIKVRKPNFPEYISENIIKNVIISKENITDVTGKCSGDLLSKSMGRIECKAFSSKGPMSFGPTEKWSILYILDAINWIDDKLIVYRINLSNDSNTWQNLKMNQKETFYDHCKAKRRPRINFDSIKKQLGNNIKEIFSGNIKTLFDLIIDDKFDNNKSDDNKSDDNKSDDNKSDDNKSDDNKSDDNKSDDNKSDDNKSDDIKIFKKTIKETSKKIIKEIKEPVKETSKKEIKEPVKELIKKTSKKIIKEE